MTKSQKLSFFYSVRGFLSMGFSLGESIRILIDTENNREIRLKLKKAIKLIEKRGYRVEKALLAVKLISKVEYEILKYSPDKKEGINKIIKIIELENKFDKFFVIFSAKIFFGWIAGIMVAKKFLPIMLNNVERLSEMVKIKSGVEIDPFDKIPPLFFYIKHYDSLETVLYYSIVFIIAFYFVYFFLSIYKPNVLYKILKVKAYDDLPVFLIISNALKSSGLNTNEIVDILIKNKIGKRGYMELYLNIKKAIKNKRPLYKEFEKFNFPSDVTSLIKSAEISRNFWENFKSLERYVIEKNETVNKILNNFVMPLSTIIMFALFIYFAVGNFLLMIQMQTIATLMF